MTQEDLAEEASLEPTQLVELKGMTLFQVARYSVLPLL